jgi:hypothetical protein
MHVEQVLGNVPPAERCHCRDEQSQEPRQGAGGDAGAGNRPPFGK